MRRSKPKTQLGPEGQRGPRYLLPHVCFRCRKSFKRYEGPLDKKCPDCGGKAIALSRKFKPPARSNERQWKKVEYLVAQGFRFASQRTMTGELAPYPRTLAEAREFVRRFRNVPR